MADQTTIAFVTKKPIIIAHQAYHGKMRKDASIVILYLHLSFYYFEAPDDYNNINKAEKPQSGFP
jgi:hypothetical protein